MTEQLLTQTQDHNRRLGRLEGIVDTEQFTEQGRQTNTRLDRMEQAIAAQGRCIEAQGSALKQKIDEQGSELRKAISAQGNRIDEQRDTLRQAINEQGDTLRQAIAEQNRRIDELMRWVVGIQVISLLALGTLILSRL